MALGWQGKSGPDGRITELYVKQKFCLSQQGGHKGAISQPPMNKQQRFYKAAFYFLNLFGMCFYFNLTFFVPVMLIDDEYPCGT